MALLLVCICTTTFSAVTMVVLLPMALIKPAIAGILPKILTVPAPVATSMITLAVAAETSAMMRVMMQVVAVVGSAAAAVTTVVVDGLAAEIMAAAVISVAAAILAAVATSVAVVTNSPTIFFL